MPRKTFRAICLFTVLGVAAPVFARPNVDYGPAGLTWDVGFAHQGARLTVVGPAGVQLTRSFAPGESLTFAAVDEAGLPLPDGAYSFELLAKRTLSAEEREVEAAGQQGGKLSWEEAQRARARFERLNGPFVVRSSGSFTIQGGQLGNHSGKEPHRAGGGAEPKDFTDSGTILAGDGLGAGSTTLTPSVGELELFFSGGTGSVEQFAGFLEVSAIDDRNDLTISTSSGNVGIATTTPARELHIRGNGSAGTSADIYLEDQGTGDAYVLNQGPIGLWFNSTSGLGVLKLQNTAPGNSIVVDPGGRVGIATDLPGANLHIFGGASSDVFNAVGPDPSIGGNALNFGYAGATFGVGSGFFNVRPAAGAVAPKPALFFATGNIDRMMIDNQGFIGVHLDGVLGPGFNPAHPIHAQTSGAFLSAGGVWTNASSRSLKQNIAMLTTDEAIQTLSGLSPVKYSYKAAPEEHHVGFIAEDVPELVATPDRTGLSPMDVVAVLTRVVQEQQQTIEALRKRVERLEGESEQ